MEAKIQTDLGPELHTACKNGSLTQVVAITSQKRATNPSYKTPFSSIMYIAASHDHANIVSYCLDAGAKVTDDVLKVILINRSKATHTLLLDRKAIAVDRYIPWFGDMLSNVATDDDLEWTKLCLSHGANPNANLYEEHKPLLAAVAELASVETASLLVEHGANVKGSGAIVLAAEAGKLDMVRFLLAKGADIDEVGIEHPTDERFREDVGSALHRAVFGGHEEVVEFLLESGARLELRDLKGRTALMVAEERGDARMEEILRGYGALK